jgi:hypothetical protein
MLRDGSVKNKKNLANVLRDLGRKIKSCEASISLFAAGERGSSAAARPLESAGRERTLEWERWSSVPELTGNYRELSPVASCLRPV